MRQFETVMDGLVQVGEQFSDLAVAEVVQEKTAGYAACLDCPRKLDESKKPPSALRPAPACSLSVSSAEPTLITIEVLALPPCRSNRLVEFRLRGR